MSETMTLKNRGCDVVVGVDGTAASINAVRYAVEEARRTGGVLHVVHVVPDYVAMAPMMAPMYPVSPDELAAAGRDVLEKVMSQLGPASEVAVNTAVLRGSRVAALTSAARGACVLVVGADRRTFAERLLTGNTSTGVAASAVAPVVAVPETWSGTPARGVVLVGVKNPAHATELLGEAFSVAEQRGSRLLVLHSWKLPSGYDDIVVDRVAHDEWNARAQADMEQMVAEWRSSCPTVDVDIRAVHDQPAHALVKSSEEVDEIVLVRRAHGIPAAVHLGATARTVLRESHCPVRIVPPGLVQRVPGLALEQSGSMQK